MEFVRRRCATPATLGVLAGAFNPPTIAHVALLEAARASVDHVVFVIPRTFPHKAFHGATLEERLRMLEALENDAGPFSIAITEGGLFIEIARECRQAYAPEVDVAFICGRDAAERIITWDYGDPAAIERMLSEFRLLVAARAGEFHAPPRLVDRIQSLDLPANLDQVSSTEIRDCLAQGRPWQSHAPAPLRAMITEIYRR